MSIEQEIDASLEDAILTLIPGRVSAVFPTATRIDCVKADCDSWGTCTLSLVRVYDDDGLIAECSHDDDRLPDDSRRFDALASAMSLELGLIHRVNGLGDGVSDYPYGGYVTFVFRHNVAVIEFDDDRGPDADPGEPYRPPATPATVDALAAQVAALNVAREVAIARRRQELLADLPAEVLEEHPTATRLSVYVEFEGHMYGSLTVFDSEGTVLAEGGTDDFSPSLDELVRLDDSYFTGRDILFTPVGAVEDG